MIKFRFHTNNISRPITVASHEAPGVYNHQRLFKKYAQANKATSKLCITGPCEGNSPMVCGFPSQRTTNAKSISKYVIMAHLSFVLQSIFPSTSPIMEYSEEIPFHRFRLIHMNNTTTLLWYCRHIFAWIFCVVAYFSRLSHLKISFPVIAYTYAWRVYGMLTLSIKHWRRWLKEHSTCQ